MAVNSTPLAQLLGKLTQTHPPYVVVWICVGRLNLGRGYRAPPQILPTAAQIGLQQALAASRASGEASEASDPTPRRSETMGLGVRLRLNRGAKPAALARFR